MSSLQLSSLDQEIQQEYLKLGLGINTELVKLGHISSCRIMMPVWGPDLDWSIIPNVLDIYQQDAIPPRCVKIVKYSVIYYIINTYLYEDYLNLKVGISYVYEHNEVTILNEVIKSVNFMKDNFSRNKIYEIYNMAQTNSGETLLNL